MIDKRFASNAEEILGLDDQAYDEVYVPQWDMWFLLRSLTGAERDAYEQSLIKGEGKKRTMNFDNMRAKLVARCVVHQETKQPIFSTRQIGELGQKNAAALEVLFDAARKLSGLSDEDVEELEGNSAADQNGSHTSAGPSPLVGPPVSSFNP
jgi:hypothetical protein